MEKMKCTNSIRWHLLYLGNNPDSFSSIDAEENEADSEYEEDDLDGSHQEAAVTQSMPKMSWLLLIALENLGVTVRHYIVSSIEIQSKNQI